MSSRRTSSRSFVSQLCAATTALLVFASATCGGQLQNFLDEDSQVNFSVLSDTVSTPQYSVKNRTLTFTATIQLDRAGIYRVIHGTDCSSAKLPANAAVTGNLAKNTSTVISITVSLDDVATYGSKVIVCASDSAAHRSGSALVDFSASVTYFNNLNDLTGAGLTTDIAVTFQVFQATSTGGTENRGNGVAGPYSASGVNRPYHHAVFIDPNDGNKMKYFVSDRNNHRVLIFNSIPTSNSAAADVVVGQTGFTTVSINAGGGATISAQGLNEPCGVAVSNSGTMFIVDRVNNRVLVYNSIPTTSGALANYAIGQPDLSSGTANNTLLASVSQRLSDPSAVHAIGGKIYIADRNNHRILVFNTTPAADGASANLAIGQPDLVTTSSGTDYTTSSSYLNHPYELYRNGSALYISDADNNRVLVFNSVPTAADTRPNLVIGQAGSTGLWANRGGSAGANTLSFPVAINVASGKLAITDQANQRVLFYNFPLSNGMAASYVIGQSSATDFLGTSTGTTATLFNVPKSLIIDSGYVWTIDQYNHRVTVQQLPF